MPALEILVGTLGSGKSTWASRRADHGWAVVNLDAIVTMIHGGDYKLFRREWNHPIYKAIQADAIYASLKAGVSVVLDCCSVDKSRRCRLINDLDDMQLPECVELRAVVFPFVAPEVHALRRTKDDARGYSMAEGVAIAKAHIKNYSDPSFDGIAYLGGIWYLKDDWLVKGVPHDGERPETGGGENPG